MCEVYSGCEHLGLDLLGDGSSGTGVDLQAGMVANLLDQPLGLKVSESLAGAGSVDLQAVNKDGGSDQLVGGDLLQHLGVGLLVHDGSMVSLLLGLALRPLLLLALADVK